MPDAGIKLTGIEEFDFVFAVHTYCTSSERHDTDSFSCKRGAVAVEPLSTARNCPLPTFRETRVSLELIYTHRAETHGQRRTEC